MTLSRPSGDPFHLQRFVDAQAACYESVRAELAGGQKRSHWMWFIFPQIQGLGSSPMAQRFAIANLKEAADFLQHPVLGPRLRECTTLVNAVRDGSISDIFGYPDDLKFHSSMTLFDRALCSESAALNPLENVFAEALSRHFHGKPDNGTLLRLQQ